MRAGDRGIGPSGTRAGKRGHCRRKGAGRQVGAFLGDVRAEEASGDACDRSRQPIVNPDALLTCPVSAWESVRRPRESRAPQGARAGNWGISWGSVQAGSGPSLRATAGTSGLALTASAMRAGDRGIGPSGGACGEAPKRAAGAGEGRGLPAGAAIGGPCTAGVCSFGPGPGGGQKAAERAADGRGHGRRAGMLSVALTSWSSNGHAGRGLRVGSAPPPNSRCALVDRPILPSTCRA